VSEIEIRPYRAKDRAALRRIVFETGYMGDPVDWLWRDPETFADLISRYYTDQEPESIFIADREGEVVGFLTGCTDSDRTRGQAEKQVRRVMLRGGLLRPGIASFLWRAIADVARERDVPSEMLGDPRWPAHLHINLLPKARGKGAGGALIRAWRERLREQGVGGLHLGTFAENSNAIAFFTAQGFERYGPPTRVPGFRTREGARMHRQWMVWPASRA